MTEKSKQEALWHGEFGNAYTQRNELSHDRLAALTIQWLRILRSTMGWAPRSILEVGANVGLNLRARRRLVAAEFYAVEPNASAIASLLVTNSSRQSISSTASHRRAHPPSS